MKLGRSLALAGLIAAAVSANAFAEVHVSLANGRVSVTARDATVRQILAEWAKVGQVRIVNAERIPGGPVTLELKDVPEEQALDFLLRAVAGYMAAPRAEFVPNASRFDRVVVMATAATPRAPVAASPAMSRAPVFDPTPQPLPDDPVEGQEEPANAVPSLNPRGPVFNPFPQPQVMNPQPRPFVPSPTPGPAEGQEADTPAQAEQPVVFPGTVAVPGMIAQPTPAPGQTPAQR